MPSFNCADNVSMDEGPERASNLSGGCGFLDTLELPLVVVCRLL